MSIPRCRQPTASAAEPFIPTLRDANDTCRHESTASTFGTMCRVARHSAALAGRERLASGRPRRGVSTRFASAHHRKVSSVRDPAPQTDKFPKLLDRVNERVALHMARELTSYVIDWVPPRGT